MRYDEQSKRYSKLFGTEPAADGAIADIESALDLTLPDDLKQIANFYRGGFLGGKSHHALAISGPAMNVVDESKRLRATIGLPHRFVVLAEPPSSLIILDCQSGEVLWCDAGDAEQLADGLPFSSPPDTWPSYGAFFDYLLTEEKNERGGL